MKSIADQDIFGEFDTKTYLSFGEGQATPANSKALEYADAVCEMLQARMKLEVAKNSIPSYTGHLRDSDYYQVEEEIYNRACDRLYSLAKLAI